MNRALHGGYVFQHSDRTSIEEAVGYAVLEPSYTLLDPLSWKAVVNTGCWDSTSDFVDATVYFLEASTGKKRTPEWKARIHRFIDYLCDGLPLEEALARATE